MQISINLNDGYNQSLQELSKETGESKSMLINSIIHGNIDEFIVMHEEFLKSYKVTQRARKENNV
jgi:predicted DNA-binding protein